MSELNVIDVSQFNGTVNWAKVEADAAIIRAGYRGYGSAGTLKTDSKFSINAAGTAQNGIPYGVYWLSQALSDDEAKEEAAYLIDLLQGLELTYPVYLDSEYSNSAHSGRADSLSKTKRTRYALVFLEAMKAAGYQVGVYASESWFYGSGAMLDVNQLTDYSLWVAKYSTKTPSIGVEYDAWQYTESGSDAGCSGNVDKSHFYKDFTKSEEETLTQEQFKELWLEYRETLQDNDSSSWSEEAREWAISSGIVQGGSTDEFNGMWEDLISREAVITILYRFAKLMGAV